MLERLRAPGGTIGTLSLISAILLAVIGGLGAVAMLVSLANGSDWWSDDESDKVFGLLFFALMFLGAVGFAVMPRSPWGGAALAILGGLALAFLLFWAILPILIGLGAATVAVLRARALSAQHTQPTPSAAGSSCTRLTRS